jgi:glycosyltransferase involved in cell wall biosynthesis
MTAKTRVLWLIKGLGAGGAEQLLVNSLPHLDRSRFEYHVAYILPWKDDNVPFFKAHDVPVHCLDGGNPLDVRIVPRLRALLEDLRIHVLDSHLPYSGVVGRLAARRAGTPAVLYTEHSLAVQRQLAGFHFVSFVANTFSYGMNDLVLAVSRDTFCDVSRFTLGRVPVRLVYNGIPVDSFDRAAIVPDRGALGVPEGHKVVGHVATFTPKKRQLDLLQAAKLVIDKDPEVTFVLVGKGALRPELEALAAALGISKHVVFPGFVPDLTAAMACFDVFALSSLYEGLPTVAIEAMALGIPVVATWVGGTPEIVNHDHDGLLVPPSDPQAMAKGILRLLGDDGLRAQMGARAEQSARSKFDIRRRVLETEAVYDEVLSTSTRRAGTRRAGTRRAGGASSGPE